MHPTLPMRSGNPTVLARLARHRTSRPALNHIRLLSASVPKEPPLSWPEYLSIRKKKRRWEMATTIPSTFLALGLGLSYFGSLESDPTSTIFGVEPIYVYGVATIACGGLGYLLGPTVGNSMWRMTHRQILPRIETRDAQFYQHIVKNRVDPSRQTATNPVPDFYGEKIGSLKDYRQWLRDQAKYKRKAQWPEE
ncbi:Presequence translocated-associated motor subunit PAM17 [Ceratobasidium theobromae]|uniref:Presequence translocated-associated motor subunit PAM17 n=1 Tax=Ceratobasidium theobromae TaxID=1582974 RepID=A0A5N5QUY6_9AGAM|nr:Presequence translocated-associated motor subunit PAM17 [Ceratobasidium theobromae]